MIEEAKKLLEKSEHALEVSENLLKNGYHSDSAGKSYYSMFYAAQSLLKSKGIELVKHSAVEAAFGYHFVKTGKIDARYHKTINSVAYLSQYNQEFHIKDGKRWQYIVKLYAQLS